jgi:trans-2,3-dihydro-3-hydroxyanthranilate isomerase
MEYRFVTLDVFTDRIFGGNPLAVFPDARGLDPAHMHAIARELNLSETVFILPPESTDGTRRLRIFTPAGEIPFAGHPTIGAAIALATLDEITLKDGRTRIVFEEGIGQVPVTVESDGSPTMFAQLSVAKLPEVGPPPPSRSAIAAILSLEAADLLGGTFSPQAVSCGLPFLFVPVRSREILRRARVKLEKWESTLSTWWAPDIFVFSRDPEREGSSIRARMFAPGLSVPEDPATGSAAAALGGYLAMREAAPTASLRWVVEQGFEMGRPSIIEVEADKEDNKVTAVRVGGRAVLVSKGVMNVPPSDAPEGDSTRHVGVAARG